MVELQHSKLLRWNPLLSPSMGYRILGDFEESAQEETVHFNLHPATQPTGIGEFQLIKTSSSNKSTLASSDFPTVFSHKPTPSTSAMPTASRGRIVIAASLSPLRSVSKQGTVMLELRDLVPRRS
jgi:hypothetical protein